MAMNDLTKVGSCRGMVIVEVGLADPQASAATRAAASLTARGLHVLVLDAGGIFSSEPHRPRPLQDFRDILPKLPLEALRGSLALGSPELGAATIEGAALDREGLALLAQAYDVILIAWRCAARAEVLWSADDPLFEAVAGLPALIAVHAAEEGGAVSAARAIAELRALTSAPRPVASSRVVGRRQRRPPGREDPRTGGAHRDIAR
jgi:hypothetical protein